MMWDLGNFWGEGKSTSTNSYLQVMHEIHVLLVDHESDGLLNTSKLLEMCQYRVTVVELASAAITTLLNGKVKVDFIMANINSPDLHGFKLLQQAVNMDIPIILMSVDDNTFMAMRAIENGAFLYIKKPAPIELLRCIWQHVAREKMLAARERERLMAANYSTVRGIEFRDVMHHSVDEPSNIGGSNLLVMKEKGKHKKAYYYNGRKGDEDYDSESHMMSQGKIKRKVCTEWTQELHEKFMDAVEQLGEGRCFPKEILDIMNVPGLTRMQVASHLQKCRNDNWRSPEERKYSLNVHPPSSDGEGSQHKPRRFGSMPRLGGAPSCQLQQTNGGGQGSKSQSESEMVNDGGVEKMGTVAVMADNASTYHHQHYGAPLLPQPAGNVAPGINSSNPRHPSADHDYFCFQEMDCLIQNFSAVPQGSAGISHPHSSSGSYHFQPVYGHDQNSKGPSMDHGSRWTGSETSNFGSDDSETRGH